MKILYDTALGEKNRTYYLAKFDKFDKKEDGQTASWNWAALFLTGFWALYRKMYGWFFVFWGLAIISNLLDKAAAPLLSSVFFAIFAVMFAIFSNALYHNNVVKKTTKANNNFDDESKKLEYLRRKGGVNTWVIWVFGSIPILGIITAILIPMLADK